MSVYRVGLTGGLACGKSTASRLFEAHGITVVDADDVVAQLTAPGGAALPALAERVGQWVLTADGHYDRAAVRARIFTDKTLRQAIESVLHPLVRDTMRARLAAAAGAYAIGAIPLLFESGGWDGYFQRVIVIECSAAVQRARAAARDPAGDAERIIAAQMDAAARRARADEVVSNDGTIDQLTAAIKTLHHRLLTAATAG